MDETLANLMIVLKTVGLNESKVGLRELEGVLRATGLTVDQLAASLNKSSTNLEHVNDLTRAHAQANRDAAMFAQRFATEQEKVLGLFQRLEAAQPHLTVEQHARAYSALSASLANAENRFVSLASVQKTAGDYAKNFASRGLQGAVDGNAAGFIGPMQEAYGPAKPSDATKTSDAITRGLEQERRVRAQLIAEKERENVLNLQAMSLLRQLETPEQAHIRRQATYNNLLREGHINQTQFTKAVEQSGHAMRTQQALGTKGGGLAAMQAGYGIQDFATVMAMGGENAFGRAMISASNNLGQMAVVMGVMNPMMTAIVATGVTLAAVLGPTLWDQISGGIEDANSSAEDFEATLESITETSGRIKEAMEQAFRVRDFSDMSASSLKGKVSSLKQESMTQGVDVAAAGSVVGTLRNQIFTENPLPNRQGIVDSLMDPRNPTLYSSPMGPMERAQEASRMAEQAYNAAVRQREEAIRGSDELKEAEKKLREATEAQAATKKELDAAEKALAEQIKIEYQRDRQQERSKQAGTRQELRRSIIGGEVLKDALQYPLDANLANAVPLAKFGLGGTAANFNGQTAGGNLTFDTATPEQLKYQNRFNALIESVTKMRGAGIQGGRAVLDIGSEKIGTDIDKEIAGLQKQNRPQQQASFSGFADFGRQFQMAISKPEDEGKKQREIQIKELQQIKEILKQRANFEMSSGVGA